MFFTEQSPAMWKYCLFFVKFVEPGITRVDSWQSAENFTESRRISHLTFNLRSQDGG
jgi:hypothetical protein